jgi:hypothetical protein
LPPPGRPWGQAALEDRAGLLRLSLLVGPQDLAARHFLVGQPGPEAPQDLAARLAPADRLRLVVRLVRWGPDALHIQ